MTHVHIRGPLLSISGYGVHARQIARWAFAQNFHVTVEILPWGNTPWYTDRNECSGLINKIMVSSHLCRGIVVTSVSSINDSGSSALYSSAVPIRIPPALRVASLLPKT